MIAFLLMVIMVGAVPQPISPHDTLAECQAAIAEAEKEYPDQVKDLRAAGGNLVCYAAQ